MDFKWASMGFKNLILKYEFFFYWNDTLNMKLKLQVGGDKSLS